MQVEVQVASSRWSPYCPVISSGVGTGTEVITTLDSLLLGVTSGSGTGAGGHHETGLLTVRCYHQEQVQVQRSSSPRLTPYCQFIASGARTGTGGIAKQDFLLSVYNIRSRYRYRGRHHTGLLTVKCYQVHIQVQGKPSNWTY